MTRLTVLERGEELSDTSWRALAARSSPVRLKLLDPAPPFLAADIVQVAPLDAEHPRPGDLLLFRSGGDFRFGPAQDGPAAQAETPLGRVIAVERGGCQLFPPERRPFLRPASDGSPWPCAASNSSRDSAIRSPHRSIWAVSKRASQASGRSTTSRLKRTNTPVSSARTCTRSSVTSWSGTSARRPPPGHRLWRRARGPWLGPGGIPGGRHRHRHPG